MPGIFPASGVPAADAKNSVQSPILTPPECEALWYSTFRCQPRFDPAAANGVMAEIINLVNCFGQPYDCNSLSNMCKILKDLFNGVYVPISTINATSNLHLANNSVFTTYTGVYSEIDTINGGVDVTLGAGTITFNQDGSYLIWGHGVATVTPAAAGTYPGVFDIGGQLGTVTLPNLVNARMREVIILNAPEVISTHFFPTPVTLGAGSMIRAQYNCHTEAANIYQDAFIGDVRYYIQRIPVKPYV